MSLKKIAIIGTVGLPAKYGGFETLTEYLTKNLETTFDITVYCSSTFYSKKLKKYNNARLKYIPFNANGAQSIFYDIISIFNALLFADVLLILGVSGCIILPFVKLISNKLIIVNIDGLEWKRAKWGKGAKLFLRYSEKIAVTYADSIVSDNKVIQCHVRDTYNVSSELIAYGADHSKKEELASNLITQYPFLIEKYAFTVCRIEPENNIYLILEAFSEFPDLNIVFIGNWNNSNYGKQLKIQFAKYENIYLLDPIYDQQKLNQIRSNCHLYVHGHSAGGTNPSLIEAMYLGLPIITYTVNYNIETTENKAKYFSSKNELISLITNLKQQELSIIAKDMKKVANINYTWKVIATHYAQLFNQ
jgi:glycosyltransferase involved in cell wall biosynthesis